MATSQLQQPARSGSALLPSVYLSRATGTGTGTGAGGAGPVVYRCTAVPVPVPVRMPVRVPVPAPLVPSRPGPATALTLVSLSFHFCIIFRESCVSRRTRLVIHILSPTKVVQLYYEFIRSFDLIHDLFRRGSVRRTARRLRRVRVTA